MAFDLCLTVIDRVNYNYREFLNNKYTFAHTLLPLVDGLLFLSISLALPITDSEVGSFGSRLSVGSNVSSVSVSVPYTASGG